MEGVSFLFILLIFLCGILFNVIWGQSLGLGYGLLSFQNSMTSSLLLLAKNVQSVYEIYQLKYIYYETINKDQKYVEFQKMIDEKELNSMKNTVIRNYINSVPKRYIHLVEFNDWNSAMEHLNKLLKGDNND